MKKTLLTEQNVLGEHVVRAVISDHLTPCMSEPQTQCAGLGWAADILFGACLNTDIGGNVHHWESLCSNSCQLFPHKLNNYILKWLPMVGGPAEVRVEANNRAVEGEDNAA